MVLPTIPSILSKIRRKRAKDPLSTKEQLEKFGFASVPGTPTEGTSSIELGSRQLPPKILPKLEEPVTPKGPVEPPIFGKEGMTPEQLAQFRKERREKQIARFLAKGGRKARTPEEAEAIAAGQQGVTEEAAPLKGQLLQDILEPPSLEPAPVVETISTFGLIPAVKIGNMITGLLETLTGEDFGETTVEELAQTPAGKALGLATLGVAGTLAAITANPILASITARSTVVSSMAAKIGALNGITKSLAVAAAGGGLLNWDGLEMATQRNIIGGFTEDGERLEALARQGLPSEFELNILNQMMEEVNYAESVLKDSGNTNILNRVATKYLDDMRRIRSARLALFRRIQAIENIALTGGAQLSPEELIATAAQFNEESIIDIPPTQLEPRTERSFVQDIISVPGLEEAKKGTIPVGPGKAAIVIPKVIDKFGGRELVPAIFERIAHLPKLTRALLKENPKVWEEIGRFTQAGLKFLEKSIK